jgi:hypothetical protein
MPRTIRTALLLTTTLLLAGCRMEDVKLMALTMFTDSVLQSAAAQPPSKAVVTKTPASPVQVCDIENMKREIRDAVRAAAPARSAKAAAFARSLVTDARIRVALAHARRDSRRVFIVTVPDVEVSVVPSRQM